MDKNQILVFSAVAAVLAVRLYLKYKQKEKAKSGTGEKSSSSTLFPASTKDEDYEPYSKK
jgi:hypothetical protein